MNEQSEKEGGQPIQPADQLRERESEATSKETLDEVEGNEKTSESQTKSDPDNSNVPSPDGTGEAPHDEPDDAGPM